MNAERTERRLIDDATTATRNTDLDGRVEAYGVRGMESKPWRKTFKNTTAMLAWADEHDAEIYGTRPA